LFKDHFSDRSREYGCFRPDYPESLYAYLAEHAPGRDLAWDCACGSGQAALGLARHFRRVVATDASAEQIAAARPAANVEYRVAAAETSGLPGRSLDLVAVAQALHWFDLDRFYAEVGRVLKPNGLLAAWSYDLLRIDPEIDALIGDLYRNELGPYWPPERRWVELGYQGLRFPFPELTPPPLAMQAEWPLSRLLGYLGTWSAVRGYREALSRDPLARLEPGLRSLWGNPARVRRVHWPLSLRIGVAPG
jgi:SAM-dependent methyltransferase